MKKYPDLSTIEPHIVTEEFTTEIFGTLKTLNYAEDWSDFEWYQASKRIPGIFAESFGLGTNVDCAAPFEEWDTTTFSLTLEKNWVPFKRMDIGMDGVVDVYFEKESTLLDPNRKGKKIERKEPTMLSDRMLASIAALVAAVGVDMKKVQTRVNWFDSVKPVVYWEIK